MFFHKLDSILPKKALAVSLAILIIATPLLAQVQMEDVVYLKDGTIIRGQILEQVPNVSIKIQTKDGSVFGYKMEDVLKITKEPLKETPPEKKGEKANGFAEGKVDGERDARGSAGWFCAGFLCGIFGAGAAFFMKPGPPAPALIGKSSEYVMGYTEGYQNKARNENTMWACGGWLVSAVAGIVYVLTTSSAQ
jgi:hypothetical protein